MFIVFTHKVRLVPLITFTGIIQRINGQKCNVYQEYTVFITIYYQQVLTLINDSLIYGLISSKFKICSMFMYYTTKTNWLSCSH